MITVVIGDVDTQTALEKIKQNFNTEYKKPVKNIFPKEKQLTSQAKLTTK